MKRWVYLFSFLGIYAHGVELSGNIGEFDNKSEETIKIITKSNIGILNNYANAWGLTNNGNGTTVGEFNNYGEMYATNNENNYGQIVNKDNNMLWWLFNITIKDYALSITKNSSNFNSFSGYTSQTKDASHLVYKGFSYSSKLYWRKGGKLILRIGGDFELDKDYKVGNLIYDGSTTGSEFFSVTYEDGSRIGTEIFSLADPMFELSINETNNKSNATFCIKLSKDASTKAHATDIIDNNLLTLNTIKTNALNQIFDKRKRKKYVKLASRESFGGNKYGLPRNSSELLAMTEKTVPQINATSETLQGLDLNNNVDSLNLAQNFIENENFYRTQRRIERRSGRYGSAREATPTRPAPRAESTLSNMNANQRSSDFRAQNANDSAQSFFFSPLVGYNQTTNFNGLNYGFALGYSAQIASNHALGIYGGFSYGKLDLKEQYAQKSDLTSIGGALGLAYKLNLPMNMYFRANVDGGYFSNDLNLAISQLDNKKPLSNFSASAEAAWGMDFDFRSAGILGIKAGLGYTFYNAGFDYDKILLQKSGAMHLIYADIGLEYEKIFDFGLYIDAALGTKIMANTPSYKINIMQNIYDFKYTNAALERFSGYAKLGIGYGINETVALDVAYVGILGARSNSHNGFFNVRVWW